MLLRLNLHQAAAENRHRLSAGIHRPLVRGRVDSESESRNHRPSGIRGGFRKMARHPHPVDRRATGSDNRDRTGLQILRKRPADIKTNRRILQIPERLRIILIHPGEHPNSAQSDPVELLVQSRGAGDFHDFPRQIRTDSPDSRQLSPVMLEHRRRRPAGLDQCGRPRRADPRYQIQQDAGVMIKHSGSAPEQPAQADLPLCAPLPVRSPE